jgi:hypothetical protein
MCTGKLPARCRKKGARNTQGRFVKKTDSVSDIVQGLSAIGAMGKGERVLNGDTEAVLFEYTGTGCLTHFWFGGNFRGVEDTRIRYYALSGSDLALSLAESQKA